MRKLAIVLLVFCLAGVATYFHKTPAMAKTREGVKNILLVQSYHKSLGWDIDTEKGFIEGLKSKGFEIGKDYDLEIFYMDTKKTYTTPEQIKMRAEEAMELITPSIDLLVVNDDNALKHVAVAYTLKNPKRNLPILFIGINADPVVYDSIDSLEKPGHNITGALERFQYHTSFSLAKRIFPQRKTLIMFADTSPSSGFLVNAMKERYMDKVKDPEIEVVDVLQIKTFKEWKEKIKEAQGKADFLGILTYMQLRDEDGNIVPAPEVVRWTLDNNKLPEIGFLQFHAEDGFLMAIGVSPTKTARYLGVLAADILEGKDPGTIPIIDPKLVDVAFNLKRAKMLDVDIPIDLLGMSSAAYDEIKSRD